MMRRALILLALLALIAPASRAAENESEDQEGTNVPKLQHVIVVILENRGYSDVRSAPYTAGLVSHGASFSASTAVAHPSLPNYLALWSGSTQDVKNDACPPVGAPYSGENLGHACEAAGIGWRAYSEDLPSVGSAACTNNGTLYTRKHDVWSYFSNLDHTNERPYTDLAVDIAAGKLPRLAFVIPNNCHNSHDGGACNVAVADQWLADNIPAMVAAVGRHGIVIVTWDEDDFTPANHILTVFSGPPAKPGAVCVRPVNHYTVLRTICDALGLTAFGAAANEKPITDVWHSDREEDGASYKRRHPK